MRVFVFIFSFLFLVQLNAAAICSVLCESTKVPPCHQETSKTNSKNLNITPNTMSERSCCDGASPCSYFDEQANLYVTEKNLNQKKLDFYTTQNFESLSHSIGFYKTSFIVTHYSINGPPLYLLYSQLKIPSAV